MEGSEIQVGGLGHQVWDSNSQVRTLEAKLGLLGVKLEALGAEMGAWGTIFSLFKLNQGLSPQLKNTLII